MTYRAALCGGIDRTGCKAACQIAAAVLNAGNAARIIRSGNVCVDIAVLNMTDDRAFALLQLAADTACGVRVGQIQALNLTGDNTAGNRTVVDACQRADVLLTGNVAVEQRNILNVRLIVLIADIAEQTGIFLFIFYAQSLMAWNWPSNVPIKPLSFLDAMGLKPLTPVISISAVRT